jgi:CelD/BcsL family acetyltransferase involved in cellulose biosynthesis
MTIARAVTGPELAAPPAAPPSWTVQRLPKRTLGPHTAAWNALWQTLPLQHPMLHGDFINTLLHHWGVGREWLCTLGSPNNPQGMCILQPGGLGMWSTFLPMQSQVGAALLHSLDDASTLLPRLPGVAMLLDLLATDPDVLPVDFSLHRPLDVTPHAYTLGMDLQDDFEAWWQCRPKKLRDNLRRHQAELARRYGQHEVRWVDSPGELPAALDRYAQLESQGWKGEGGTAVAPGSDQHRFYADLARDDGTHRTGAACHVVATELWADGELLASRLLWVSPSGDVTALKTTYAEQHKAVAPGRLLLHATLQQAHRRWPGRRFELCTDATGDLAAWADRPRHTRHLSLYRNAYARGLRHALKVLVRSIRPLQPEAPGAGRSPPMSCRSYGSLQELPASALRLLASAEHRSVQLGSPWLQALESNVFAPIRAAESKPPQPLYAVLIQGEEALAVWPLAVRPSAPPQLEALANYYCAFTGPVLQPWCKPKQLLALVQHLQRTVPQAHTLRLQPLDPNHHTTHTLRKALRLAGYGLFAFFAFHNWVWCGQPDWKGYFASRSANLRSNVRRANKRLHEAGGRIEIIHKPSDVARGMAAYEAVYAQSWKQAEPCPMFFRNVATAFAERGQLRLGLAWLGDKVIAAQFWTVAHGVAEIHKLAYDEAHKALGAGTALSAALFERVLDVDRAHTIDYLIGDDPYKALWMDQRRQRWGFLAGRVVRPRGALVVAEQVIRRTGKRLLAGFRRATQSTSDGEKS